MNFFQDLEIGQAILGDVASFAAGNPVSLNKNIGGKNVSVSVVKLPNGPVAPYQVIQGGFLGELEMAFTDVEALAAGATINVAEKVGNDWYGLTASLAAAA